MTTPGAPRQANLMIPMDLPTGKVRMLISMPEPDARAIANTSDDLARELGPVYELIRDSLAYFLEKEG